MRTQVRVGLLGLIVLVTGAPTPCMAAALRPGDVVVATQENGGVYVVNPRTGAVTTVSTFGLLVSPSHVRIDPRGIIYTTTRDRLHGTGVVATNPADGSQRHVAGGPLLSFASALAFDRDHNLYVGTEDGRIVHVNVATGAQRLVATVPVFVTAQDVEVDPAGNVLVVDFGPFNAPQGRIYRVNPASGAVHLLASGDHLFNPVDLLVHPSGDYVVSNRTETGTQILRIDPNTGAQRLAFTIPSNGFIALEDERTAVFTGSTDEASLYRFDLETGERSVLSFRPFASGLVGIAVYGAVPEPTGPALSGAIATGALLRRRRRT